MKEQERFEEYSSLLNEMSTKGLLIHIAEELFITNAMREGTLKRAKQSLRRP